MKKKKKNSTTHHIIPRKHLSEFQLTKNNPENLIKLENRIHTALHQLFWNKKPKEQLVQWYSINCKVLSKEVCDKLMDLLTIPDQRFYKFNRKK